MSPRKASAAPRATQACVRDPQGPDWGSPGSFVDLGTAKYCLCFQSPRARLPRSGLAGGERRQQARQRLVQPQGPGLRAPTHCETLGTAFAALCLSLPTWAVGRTPRATSWASGETTKTGGETSLPPPLPASPRAGPEGSPTRASTQALPPHPCPAATFAFSNPLHWGHSHTSSSSLGGPQGPWRHRFLEAAVGGQRTINLSRGLKT